MKKHLSQQHILLLFINMALLSSMVLASTCPGCLDLDDVNFDKTLKRFPYALVKFETDLRFEEQHEEFGAFSQLVHSITEDLLIANVDINFNGDNANKELGKRFNVDGYNFPAILLFRNGEDKPIPLPSHMDLTLNNLKAFVSSNTDLYIGREGCIKELNDLAKNFVNLTEVQQKERFTEAEKLKESLSKHLQKSSAKFYLIFMEKIMQNGYAFVEKETKRLQRLKAGKVSEARKSELKIKLNILESFRVYKLTKEEL